MDEIGGFCIGVIITACGAIWWDDLSTPEEHKAAGVLCVNNGGYKYYSYGLGMNSNKGMYTVYCNNGAMFYFENTDQILKEEKTND